jgi:class I fructose-bisphosphate aldolase
MKIEDIKEILGDEANFLLNHVCEGISKKMIHPPGADFITRVVEKTDRNNRVLNNFHRLLYSTGRLAGTGYLSILPVDQGVEHTAAASFGNNPIYFDPESIIQLAIKGGCNAVASTLGVLGSLSRQYARSIPFIVKLNHAELLTKPELSDQTMFADVEQAYDIGAAAVGATVYYGSPDCRRQIQEVSQAFKYAHELGMVTILWCYLRNKTEFVKDGKDYHTANDLESQANYLGATIEADIIKQKLSELTGGFPALNYSKNTINKQVYEKLAVSHPIDWNRWQLANCYMGRVGLINSGGPSGKNDLLDAVRAAVINKRSGGMGLILGRKAFTKEMEKGIEILKAVQDVYLCPEIDLA